MKFPKTKKFLKYGYAKLYSFNGTRIYRILDIDDKGNLTLLRVGLYRREGYKPSKAGRPFFTENRNIFSGIYYPCKVVYTNTEDQLC